MANEVKNETEDLLVCSKCGANMELRTQEGRETAVCPYCGFTRILPRELTPEEREAHMHALAYERERARLKAEEEYNAAQNARVKRGRRIALAVILTPILIGVIIGIITAIFGDPTLERIDPFEEIAVTFSGLDGAGRANIIGHAGVTYSCENDGELSENGTALITASSSSYNLKQKKKEFTVTGLDLYVTEASMLDEECMVFLREFTKTAIEKEFGATGSYLSSATKFYESWEWKPAGVYLTASGSRTDKVFDVIELTFKKGDAVVTEYAAYCFENVVRRNSSVAPASFLRSYFYGPTIDIGSLGVGSNPVWGTYMGAMTGYDSMDELERSLRTDFAGWDSFQRLEG